MSNNNVPVWFSLRNNEPQNHFCESITLNLKYTRELTDGKRK